MSKPKGYFDKVLAIDCETTGINFDGDDVTKGYQSIAWGVIVADALTFDPIEKVYVEIKWDGVSKWDTGAEKIHGLSKEHLEKNGMDSEEAVEHIVSMMYTHFTIDEPIVLLGQNVGRFDLPFFRKLLLSQGIPAKFAYRTLDTFALGYGMVRAHNSDELFEILGIKRPTPHNALSDAEASLKSYKVLNKLVNRCLAS